MLFSKTRLRREKDIQRVLRKGKNVFHELCGMRYVSNGLDVTRFAVVIGSKVDKRAVARNRLRRQYREIMRLLEPSLVIGHDILLFPSKASMAASYAEKQQSLKKLLLQHELMATPSIDGADSAISEDSIA